MNETMISNEPVLRFGFFLGVFLLMAVWEILAPRRERVASRKIRWTGNFGVVLISTLLVRFLIPTAAVGLAMIADERGWGLFHHLSLPYGLVVFLSVLFLDFAIYLQHVLFHAVPILWRLHRMHHADLDFDVTTGVRFHPVEILFSMGIKMGVVVALGPPAVAVLVFEILLNATSMFNHGNVRIPRRLDGVLRWIVVTPEMHRVHHSIVPSETNSNFGFNSPWWDRLLGTYRAEPRAGHLGMTIGINQFRDIQDLRLDRMLVQPFLGKTASYPINRREKEV